MKNQRFISKRAMDFSYIKKMCSGLWRESAGPFENTLRLLSYLLPFIPGVGTEIFIFETIASWVFNFGLDDLGKYIDNLCSFGPDTEINESLIPIVQQKLTANLEAKASDENSYIVKKAFFGSILLWTLLKKLIPKTLGPALKILFKAMKLILLAWGVNTFADVGKKIRGTALDIKEKGVGEYIGEKMMPQLPDVTKLI